MKLAGNDILIQSLINEGVEYIFGYPGGAALHIYDAIFNQDKMQHCICKAASALLQTQYCRCNTAYEILNII